MIVIALAYLLLRTFVVFSQTQIETNQLRQSAPVVVEWARCQGSGEGKTPEGVVYKWDCAGLELVRFRYSDGSTKVYTLAPASPEVINDTKFIPIPLKP